MPGIRNMLAFGKHECASILTTSIGVTAMTDIATRVLASAVATVATFAKHGLRFESSGLRRANLDAAMGDM